MFEKVYGLSSSFYMICGTLLLFHPIGLLEIGLIHVWKNPWDFLFFTLPALGNSRQNKVPPLEIPQNYVTNQCYIPWKFRGQNPRSLEIPHDFFLVTSGDSTSFLINPLEIPHVISSTHSPLFLFIFWNSPLISPLIWSLV